MVSASEDHELMYNEEIVEYMAKMREKSEAFFSQAGTRTLEVYRIMQFTPVLQMEEFHG